MPMRNSFSFRGWSQDALNVRVNQLRHALSILPMDRASGERCEIRAELISELGACIEAGAK